MENSHQTSSFKTSKSFADRQALSRSILAAYPDRIPLIVEPAIGSRLPKIDRRKYLVPYDMTLASFMSIIRARLHLPSKQAIYLRIGNDISPAGNSVMSELYSRFYDEDGFLYVRYKQEETYG